MDNCSVTYVLKNDLGGITSLIQNLISFRGNDSLPQRVIFLKIAGNNFATYEGDFVKDIPVSFFEFSKNNNFYYSFKKLKKAVGDEGGVLVSNDTHDLLMLSHYNINKKVIQIVHDAYNVRLSIQFESVIDQFICHSFFYYEVLCQLLPGRRDDIHFISYGIPINTNHVQRINNDQLHLVFIGRHDKTKGIYDLFEINAILKKNNVIVKWLILGKGPETAKVKEQWSRETNVEFYTAKSSNEIIELCKTQDIFIFPTKFEGFPVAMVEAMSVGCVPVVSDLPGGIRELGGNGNAIICELNNNNAFAEAIIKFNSERATLRDLSSNCVGYIANHHNAAVQSVKYQQFFKDVALREELPRHHKVRSPLGSRLDQTYIPNFITKFVRTYFF